MPRGQDDGLDSVTGRMKVVKDGPQVRQSKTTEMERSKIVCHYVSRP